MCANETIIANMHISITPVDMVVRQDCGAECYSGVLPDMNAAGISLVEPGTEGNHGSLPDIHVPNPNEVLATEHLHRLTQLVTYPGG